jgi:hypothetical protein
MHVAEHDVFSSSLVHVTFRNLRFSHEVFSAGLRCKIALRNYFLLM